jgi:PAS domain S-box-containing protein
MALASASSISIVLHQCCDGFVRHLNAAFARIWTLARDDEFLELQASAGLYTHLDGPHRRIRVGEFKIGRIASNRKPHLTNAVYDDPNISNREWAKREGMQAFAGFPLMVEDRVVGVMAMFARAPITAGVLTELPPLVDGIAQFIERRRVEQEVLDAHSRLDSALAAAEIGTWEYDAIRNVVRADKNLARMFGATAAEAAGGTLDAYLRAIHPDDRSRVAATIGQTLESDSDLNIEYRLIGLEGKVTWVNARGRVERDADGRALRLPGVVVDITERKRAEELLRKSEEQRRLALDAGELGAWNIDPNTKLLESDERFRLIFSGKTEPIDYESAFGMIHPEDLERVREAVAAATQLNDPLPYAEEYRVVHPNGRVRWVFGKGRANFATEGIVKKLLSFDGTVADITDRKQMEVQLRKVAADMSEADHRKDEFLAMLAHELRNPLAPIRNALQIVQMAAGDEKAVYSAAEMIERQVHHMVRLVDDLLDVSRITRGKIDLRLERVDLGAVIRQAIDTSRPAIENARHKLTMTLPMQTIWLNADPIRLAQVFGNLLNNACKYSEPEGRITLTAEVQEHEVAISVKDTGIGIPAKMLPRVFDLFTQVDQSLERSQGGLGIGLSLVKNLVELHGGSVSVTSEGSGRGSEFVVRLPTFAAQPVTAENPKATKPPLAASRRVLVVDDNHDSAMSLAMLLRLKGNEARTAHDGLEAVEVAAEFLPELVLLDIGLPKLNGYEAARRIRDQAWGKSMVLVALTGWGKDEDRRKSSEAGFNSHLVKPVEYSAILKMIAELPARQE